jgi:hypothetical protein
VKRNKNRFTLRLERFSRRESGTVQAKRKVIAFAAISAFMTFGSVVSTPLGSADCTDANGLTICGDDRGIPGIHFPYPCEHDWLCNGGPVSSVSDDSTRVTVPTSAGRGNRTSARLDAPAIDRIAVAAAATEVADVDHDLPSRHT